MATITKDGPEFDIPTHGLKWPVEKLCDIVLIVFIMIFLVQDLTHDKFNSEELNITASEQKLASQYNQKQIKVQSPALFRVASLE